MISGIQGKVAIITGGSRGIGKAIAMKFAAEGARLTICARNEEDLARTADEISAQTHADILVVKANMTKMNDIKRVVSAAVKKFERIDILVNNAGGAHIGGVFTTTDETWEYHIQLKLLGYIRMAREVIPFMNQNGGRIINIAGMAGKEPGPLYLVPAVTNGGILNFTKSLSKELMEVGILVNCINPSTTETPLTEETIAKLAAIQHTTPLELRTSLVAATPHHRFASAENIADTALFLASDAASYISGISINVDAGRSAGVW